MCKGPFEHLCSFAHSASCYFKGALDIEADHFYYCVLEDSLVSLGSTLVRATRVSCSLGRSALQCRLQGLRGCAVDGLWGTKGEQKMDGGQDEPAWWPRGRKESITFSAALNIIHLICLS